MNANDPITTEAASGGVAAHTSATPPETAPRWSLSHALRLKAAEYWLQMGEPNQALRELDRLPKCIWGDPRVIKARLAAVGVLRGRNESPLVE